MSDYSLATTLFVSIAATSVILVFFFKDYIFGSSKVTPFITREGQKVKLIEKIPVSHDTDIFRFSLGSKNSVLGLPIGKHIRITCENPPAQEAGKWNGRDDVEAGRPSIERKYTPITLDSNTTGHFDLLVKVYRPNDRFIDGGKMSQHLESLKVGDYIDVSGPFGVIEYKGNGVITHVKTQLKATHLAMIAGGSGITPMYQLIQTILNNPEDNTNISLIYANQTEDDILLRTELDAYAAKYPNKFSVHYTLDRPPANGWRYSTGFVSEEMITGHLPTPSDTTVCLICGPPPMVKFACHANLDKVNWPTALRLQF